MRLHLAAGQPDRMLDCITLFLIVFCHHPLRDLMAELSVAAATEQRAVSSRLDQIQRRALTRRYEVLLRERLE
ncbi:hypothetical protein [Rhodopirellula europaea]|uniref:Uncharacterized protein n=1 Tax=Rhodopirellula europaea SH398 TaxID=1263868 RepID=M5RXM4_9BACT|nr:hypothetical protein [Rhodopirellula europaea]EMI24050.1 hypothetical protein RESH_05372 [Rhodopirellula europaea SH398]